MPSILIPDLGDKITLAKDWVFIAQPEKRNESLFVNKQEVVKEQRRLNQIQYSLYEECRQFCNKNNEVCLNKAPAYAEWIKARDEAWSYGHSVMRGIKEKSFTIPAGTQLEVDRIYIRKGAEGFSSVTFKATGIIGKKGVVRFWVKLSEANKIVIK